MNVTLAEIAAVCGAVATISGLVAPILALIWKTLRKINGRLSSLEGWNSRQQCDIDRSLSERRVIMKGVRACLDGLSQQGCGGNVEGALEEMDSFMLSASHKGASGHSCRDGRETGEERR